MTMNGHFAPVGETPTKEQYERGIQVIDEEKAFTYAKLPPALLVPY
jgi:protein SEY1